MIYFHFCLHSNCFQECPTSACTCVQDGCEYSLNRKIITLLKTLLGIFFLFFSFFLNWICAALEQEFCSSQQCHRGRHVCRRLSSLFVDVKGPSPLWATSFPKLGSESKESSLADRPCGCIHFSLCM